MTIRLYTKSCISAHHPNAPVFATRDDGSWFSITGYTVRRIAKPDFATIAPINEALMLPGMAERIKAMVPAA